MVRRKSNQTNKQSDSLAHAGCHYRVIPISSQMFGRILRQLVIKAARYSGSPYNGAVVQGKPPITVFFMTVVGVHRYRKQAVSYTGAPYNGQNNRYRDHHRYEEPPL